MKRYIINQIARLLFPDNIKCIVCNDEIHPSRYGLCDKCKLDINSNYCIRCGRHKIGMGDYCDECAGQSLFFDEARSAVNYDDTAKILVQRFKYSNARYLARFLAQQMLDVLIMCDWHFDCVTFVPMHKTREKKRGYNQARLLAEEISEHVNIPCLSLLEKTKNTINQAKLVRVQRKTARTRIACGRRYDDRLNGKRMFQSVKSFRRKIRIRVDVCIGSRATFARKTANKYSGF